MSESLRERIRKIDSHQIQKSAVSREELVKDVELALETGEMVISSSSANSTGVLFVKSAMESSIYNYYKAFPSAGDIYLRRYELIISTLTIQ